MTYEEQKKEWKKKRQEIYEKVLDGKKSQRAIGIEYGLSNTRIGQIFKEESKALDKTLI